MRQTTEQKYAKLPNEKSAKLPNNHNNYLIQVTQDDMIQDYLIIELQKIVNIGNFVIWNPTIILL